MTRRQRFFKKKLAELRAARDDFYRRGIIWYRNRYAILYSSGYYYLLKRRTYHWQVITSSTLYSRTHEIAIERIKLETGII